MAEIAEIFASLRKSGSRNTMVTSDISPEVEIRPVRACAMHPAIIIIGTVRSLWTWLWSRYHVPQNAFLVSNLARALVNHQLFLIFQISKRRRLKCDWGQKSSRTFALFTHVKTRSGMSTGETRAPAKKTTAPKY